MGIKINANKIFDIMVAGGILLLMFSFTSDKPDAASQGWSLITLGAVGFFVYIFGKIVVRRAR